MTLYKTRHKELEKKIYREKKKQTTLLMYSEKAGKERKKKE